MDNTLKKLPFLFLILFTTKTVFATTDSCSEIKIGSSKRINLNRLKSPSKIEMKYTIKRKSEKLYNIYLNLKFKKKRSYDGSKDILGSFNKFWRSEVQSCFNLANSSLIDSSDRKIRLYIWDKVLHKEIPKPPRVRIKMVNSKRRAHSRAYNSTIGCSTLIHEAFHLLGLVDEYQEEWMALNPHLFKRVFKYSVPSKTDNDSMFNCRSAALANSLMGDHYKLSWLNGVLGTGHMDAIIYPNCTKRNSLYYACAGNAYRTSKDNGGFLGCKKVPAECDGYNWTGI